MTKPYGLVNQKLCYIQMLLDIEKSGEEDKDRSGEWLVNKNQASQSEFMSLPKFTKL